VVTSKTGVVKVFPVKSMVVLVGESYQFTTPSEEVAFKTTAPDSQASPAVVLVMMGSGWTITCTGTRGPVQFPGAA